MGFLIGTLSYFFIGYAIWIWQFNSAFAIPNPLGQAIKDWWIGGDFTNTFAQNLDPAVAPAQNTFQIFISFLALYAGFICVLIHFAGAERLRARAYYIMCVGIGALGCGYWIPELGYFGIAMSTSGVGVVFNNIFVAYAVGGVVGAFIAYKTKNVIHALLGPLAGYVAGTAAFDVVPTWQMLLIAIGGPVFTWIVYEALRQRGIDETKAIPLGLGAGLYGALIVGFAQWGEKTGGYFGLEEGTYAFQGAEITPWWQLIGIGATVAIAVLAGLVLIHGLDRIVPLRVPDDQEVKGLDPTYWDVAPAGTEGVLSGGGGDASPPPVAARPDRG